MYRGVDTPPYKKPERRTGEGIIGRRQASDGVRRHFCGAASLLLSSVYYVCVHYLILVLLLLSIYI